MWVTHRDSQRRTEHYLTFGRLSPETRFFVTSAGLSRATYMTPANGECVRWAEGSSAHLTVCRVRPACPGVAPGRQQGCWVLRRGGRGIQRGTVRRYFR